MSKPKRNLNLKFIFLMYLGLLFQKSSQQITNTGCTHPSNYSDFTLLLVNNSIVVTGGNTVSLEIWSQDISNGFNVNNDCWSHESIHFSELSDYSINNFSSYKNGIGFQVSNSSFIMQAGDYANSFMMNLSLFDLSTNILSRPLLQGIQPDPRSRMSVSINETLKMAWFYGGRSELTAQSTNYFNSFYSLDLTTFSWNWPKTYYSGGQRPARYGHSSNLISERLFIIGGKTAVYSNDTHNWVISPGDFQSILVFDTNTHQGISMATIGDIPPAAYSFSTVNAPDGRSIVLFGGQNVSSEETFDATNDVYLLDTCTLNWTKPNIKGTPPIARAGHEAITFRNRYMIVMMGIMGYKNPEGAIYVDNSAILDMETWKWISEIPTERSDSSEVKTPKCRFTFPVVIPSNDDNSNNNNGIDTTVISGLHKSSTTKKLALGITFGLLSFILLSTVVVLYIFRIRKDVDATKNPRWLPSALRRRKRDDASLSPSTSSNRSLTIRY